MRCTTNGPNLFKVGLPSKTLYEVSVSTKTYKTINDWENVLEPKVANMSIFPLVQNPSMKGLEMSFPNRVYATSTSKAVGNGIDHTLDNTGGIFMFPLLAFSGKLLVIVNSTSRIHL